MFDEELAAEILSQIERSTELILQRFSAIHGADDFVDNDTGLEKLDAICMQLIAIGESLKNFDKITEKNIFSKYPEFEWKLKMLTRQSLETPVKILNS